MTNELFSLKALNKMEAQYLSLIQYNVTVNSSLYASCYFELRALCEKEEQGFPIKPLGVLEAKRLEERSGAMFKKERNHRAKSTDALALAARGPEPPAVTALPYVRGLSACAGYIYVNSNLERLSASTPW